MTQPYIYVYPFSPRLPSHPGCHITWSRVPCVLVVHFKYSSVYIRQFLLETEPHVKRKDEGLPKLSSS